jgi:hypothetical protein
MKPGFHLRMLKLKNSQRSGFINIQQPSQTSCLPARKQFKTVVWNNKRVPMVEFMQQDNNSDRSVLLEYVRVFVYNISF